MRLNIPYRGNMNFDSHIDRRYQWAHSWKTGVDRLLKDFLSFCVKRENAERAQSHTPYLVSRSERFIHNVPQLPRRRWGPCVPDFVLSMSQKNTHYDVTSINMESAQHPSLRSYNPINEAISRLIYAISYVEFATHDSWWFKSPKVAFYLLR